MLTGGPSVAYAKKILLEEKSAILIVGYLDEEAPGKQIIDSKLGQPIELTSEDGSKETVPRRCEVREYKLSAHSDQKALVKFATSYEPLAVFLVHGETRAKNALAKAMLKSDLSPILIPENEEEIDVDKLIRSWLEIEFAKTRGFEGEPNVAYEKCIKDLWNMKSVLTLETFKQVLTDSRLLVRCGSLTKVKQTMYALFAHSLKNAQKAEGLDFEFPAMVLTNGAMFIRSLFGKRFERRFLREFQKSIPSMFKNLVLFKGPILTRKRFEISIESKGQLLSSIKSFGKHFAELGIQAPEVSDIQNLCKDCVKDSASEIMKSYERVFTEPPTSAPYTPIEIPPPKEALVVPPASKEGQTRREKVPAPTLKHRPKRTRKEKTKLAPVTIPEGLIGIGGRYEASPKKARPESVKPLLEVRETFLTTEPTCIFCGSTKLRLLKVVSIDSKTHRKEYRCEDCQLAFAVKSVNV
jgi:hypothetical protein